MLILKRVFVFIFIPLLLFAQKDNSGPTISAHSDVFFSNGKWYCPLCRQVVKNGDRSKIDPKLLLSEWHDVFLDKDYFLNKIRNISDKELIYSLNIPKMNKILKEALKKGENNTITKVISNYFKTRNDNKRLFNYDSQNRKYFITIEDFVSDINKDSSRKNKIINSFNTFYNNEKGYTLYDVNFGKKIDFNYNYSKTSKWGVHYLYFIDDLVNYYLLTKDTEIPKIFEDVFNQWYDQIDLVFPEVTPNHKKVYDVVWYELGLSVRVTKLIDAFRVFGQHISPETNIKMLKIILGSSRWLFECLNKTPFHPYNWQTSTSIALSYIACVFPEFKESNIWYKKSKNNLILHLKNDIFDDGGYVERTTSYADWMFATFYRYMLMEKYFKNDESIQKEYLARLEKFIEFFVYTQTPIGVNAPFNDAKRSKGLITLFKEMAIFFNRGDFLGGVKECLSQEELESLKINVIEPKVKSIDFPISKFTVMRDSWNKNSYFMIVNYGEFQNHCHYDNLDFEIYANGVPLAIDAGIGKFGYIDTLHSSWYKHPISHNMLTINQAVPEKIDKPGYNKIWEPQKFIEYFAATHDGYLKYQKTKHRRNIVFVKNKYWFILDKVFTKEKNKDIDYNLHTPLNMEEIPSGYISKSNVGFMLLFDRSDSNNITKMKSKGMADLTDLPNENENREIDWLIFRKESVGDSAQDIIATIIIPYNDVTQVNNNECFIEKIEMIDKSANGYKISTQYGNDIIIISDGKYRRFMNNIEGDFKLCYINYENNQIKKISMTDVSKFNIDNVFKESFNIRKNYENER